MYDEILVPTDGSGAAQPAIDRVLLGSVTEKVTRRGGPGEKHHGTQDVTAKRVAVVRTRMSTTDDTPEVPIVCPECETTTRIPVDDLPESLDRHNEQLHDGEEVAMIDPEIAGELQDLVAEDLGLLD